MREIMSGGMQKTTWLWLKRMMCDRRIGEPIAKWTGEKIEEKIDNSIDGKSAGRIGRWTGEKTARWIGARIDRLIARRTTDQTLAANSAGLIGPIMLPANVAVTEGTTLVRCRWSGRTGQNGWNELNGQSAQTVRIDPIVLKDRSEESGTNQLLAVRQPPTPVPEPFALRRRCSYCAL
jgi:hypothetical protein